MTGDGWILVSEDRCSRRAMQTASAKIPSDRRCDYGDVLQEDDDGHNDGGGGGRCGLGRRMGEPFPD